jgi:phenylacetate-CoA ligase
MSQARPQIGEWSSFEELRELQRTRLPATLAQAGQSPFYRRRDAGRLPAAPGPLGSLEALRSLEPTRKDDLREQYPFGLLAVGKENLATYHESSGTSGRPTASYYTASDWDDLAERYARKWVGIFPSDTFLVRTPYALMITGHLAHAAARLHGATVVPGDSRSAAMPHARVVRALHDLEVTLTWSNPTETLLWAAAAQAADLQPGKDFPALRALFVGGEPLSAARRRRISAIWGVPVVEEYGSTETGSLAGQCPSGQLHLWADRAVFEVQDPVTGRITDEGAGQLVVTPLYRDAMPLLRYNLEDDVEISYQPCDCGWRLPTVRVLGRSAFAYPVGSGRVTQDVLEQLVFDLPVEYGVLFWRARADVDLLRVEIEVPDGRRARAVAGLTEAVDRELRVPNQVVGVPPGSLVPRKVLTADPDVLKPRGLFGADEDWDRGVLYY